MPVSKRFKREARREIKRLREQRAAEETPDYLRGPRSKLNKPQTYLRDERMFMKLLRRFVPKQHRHMIPDRPGLLMRSGFGVNPFNSLMADDRIWDQSSSSRRAKGQIMRIYNKWKGKDWAL